MSHPVTAHDGTGHFVGAARCTFVRHHHVGRYCISSVGDYHPCSANGEQVEVGSGRAYETMVFDTEAPGARWIEVWGRGSNDPVKAEEAHAEGIAFAIEKTL